MVPATLSSPASSHIFFAGARTDHFPLHYRSISFPKQVHNGGSRFVPSPSRWKPVSRISFVVISSIHGYQGSGQRDQHFQSSNFSPLKNESVLGTLPQRTSKAVRKAGDSEKDLFTRRLVIFSHDERRKLGRTPHPREDVIERLLHETWRPQCCFVSHDSRKDPSPSKITWERMKNLKDSHGKVVLLSPEEPRAILLEASKLALTFVKHVEKTFEDNLSELNEEIKTIMVMTIVKKEDFERLVKYLVGKSNIGFDHDPPYIAMLETKHQGDPWDEDQELQENQWNLFCPKLRRGP